MAFQPLKLIVVGDAGSGKTTLVKLGLGEEAPIRYVSTIGADAWAMTPNRDNQLRETIQVWDCGPYNPHSCLDNGYYQSADGIIIISRDPHQCLAQMRRVCPNASIATVLPENAVPELFGIVTAMVRAPD